VARECHSAVRPSPKAVSGSRDRGCNGHRILRRVPNDRRHPSPKRGAGFHETAQTMGLAISASSDPLQPVKTRASGEDKETGNVGEARRSAEDVTRGRDRGVRGSAACAPWEENAHARVFSPRGNGARGQHAETVRRSGLGCRETLGPPIVSSGALVSGGRPRWATSGASWERTRCGCT
jgi:hypothetical protein